MKTPFLEIDETIDKVNEKISLIKKNDGLTFGTDAYLLAAFMRPCKKGTAVELGAGTGIISLLCAARERFAHIYAFEIQEDFASLTERNISLNDLSEKITIKEADIRNISIKDTGKEIDVVFANPHYMRINSGKRNDSDRKYIARHEVCGTVDDFCAAANRLLKHGGKFYCVWRSDRLSELMISLVNNRLEPKNMIFVHGDINTEPSIVLIEATKGAAAGMHVLPPLILHASNDRADSHRLLSERAQKIYDTMSFYD